MAAASKRAKKVRVASDFNLIGLAPELKAPKVTSGSYAWTLDSIRQARDAQMLGRFAQASRLAAASRTDYAIFSSFLNRLAPQHGLPVKLEAANETARALRIRDEGEALFGKDGVGIHPDTLTDIDATLTNHGVAFGINVVTPREDGSRIDYEHKSWPIEFVRWDQASRSFRTQVDGQQEEAICHGDGRWVVYKQHDDKPWQYGAILPCALLWADHAFGVRDRAKASSSHGNAKIVGTMPEGVAIESAPGVLTPEGNAFRELLRVIASAETPVGIKPYGSTLDYITNNSQAWQIFKEIIDSGDKAADRIYLGVGVTAPSSGGDAIGYLFGVRNDIVEGSLRAIERGILTGIIEPWCALNFGDSTLAPVRRYLMPDVDEDARRKSVADRTTAFYDAIQKAKANGFDVNQGYIDQLADDYGIVAPKLPLESIKAPTVTLAPTDIAKVVKVNEARASGGLGPLTLLDGSRDPDGELTVSAFSAKQDRLGAAPPAPALPAPATPPLLKSV